MLSLLRSTLAAQKRRVLGVRHLSKKRRMHPMNFPEFSETPMKPKGRLAERVIDKLVDWPLSHAAVFTFLHWVTFPLLMPMVYVLFPTGGRSVMQQRWCNEGIEYLNKMRAIVLMPPLDPDAPSTRRLLVMYCHTKDSFAVRLAFNMALTPILATRYMIPAVKAVQLAVKRAVKR